MKCLNEMSDHTGIKTKMDLLYDNVLPRLIYKKCWW